MNPHPRIRKTIKWGGAVVTVLLVVVWIGSGWWGAKWNIPGLSAGGLSNGSLCVESQGVSEKHAYFSYGRVPFGWRVKWAMNGRGVAWVDIFPLWPVCVIAMATTATAWRLDILARRRARLNLCPKCGYDRTGLARGAVCPECGADSSGSHAE